MPSTRSREFLPTASEIISPDASHVSGSTRGSDYGVLAEIASFQLEYTAVAQASKNKEHWDKVCTIAGPTCSTLRSLRSLG